MEEPEPVAPTWNAVEYESTERVRHGRRTEARGVLGVRQLHDRRGELPATDAVDHDTPDAAERRAASAVGNLPGGQLRKREERQDGPCENEPWSHGRVQV